VSDYEDAYYHYFQIPQDSRELPQALFEAAWSMYQKRDLEAARGLVQEFLRTFPSSPLVPEARLLAGYVELADCQFAAAQRAFDRVLRDFTPVARHLGRLRATPRLRRALFARALARHQESDAAQTARRAAQDLDGQVLGLLRLDPGFVRLHRAVFGLRQWAAPGTGWVAACARTGCGGLPPSWPTAATRSSWSRITRSCWRRCTRPGPSSIGRWRRGCSPGRRPAPNDSA
jgi:hypothetical protein